MPCFASQSATKLWLAIKESDRDDDSESIVFLEKTDGLTVLAKASYATHSDGTISASGTSGNWTVPIKIKANATSKFFGYTGTIYAEVKALISGDVVVVFTGECVISNGIVRAVS